MNNVHSDKNIVITLRTAKEMPVTTNLKVNTVEK